MTGAETLTRFDPSAAMNEPTPHAMTMRSRAPDINGGATVSSTVQIALGRRGRVRVAYQVVMRGQGARGIGGGGIADECESLATAAAEVDFFALATATGLGHPR